MTGPDPSGQIRRRKVGSGDLASTIRSVTSGQPSRPAVNRFVQLCYSMALATLRLKAKTGHLYRNAFDTSTEDLALDCIAGLFERKDGRFVRLMRYYGKLESNEWGDAGLTAATRRLVQSAVRDRLFEWYRDNDPQLARLIRNIKRAAEECDHVTIERLAGRAWLVFKQPVNPPDKPECPEDQLIDIMAPGVKRGLPLCQILQALERRLSGSSLYRSAVRVTSLAGAIRTTHLRLNVHQTPGVNSIDPGLNGDILKLLEVCVTRIEPRLRATYVDSGKVDQPTLDAYLRAARRRLIHRYTNTEPDAHTDKAALETELGSMDSSKYRKNHRFIFEYVIRIIRNALVDAMQEEGLVYPSAFIRK